MPTDNPVVLGIDPGTHHAGFGVITQIQSRLIHLHSGVITAPKTAPLEKRLLHIHKELLAVIRNTSPTLVAVESIFYAKNVQSAITLAHARGVVLLAAAEMSLPVAEYSPMEVKMATVGFGRATKEQVTMMIGHLFAMPKEEHKSLSDRTDALAVALCHLNTSRTKAKTMGMQDKAALARSKL